MKIGKQESVCSYRVVTVTTLKIGIDSWDVLWYSKGYTEKGGSVMRQREEVETVFSDQLLSGHLVVRTGTMFIKRRRLTKGSSGELLWLQRIYYMKGREKAIDYLRDEYSLPRKLAELLFLFTTGEKGTETGILLAKKYLKMDIPKATLLKPKKPPLVLDKEALSIFKLGETITNEVHEDKQ